MIAPIPPPMEEPAPWDNIGDPNTAAWRERERRQRTVRLLMMFLLMLILMDGEEQSTRRRRDSLLRKRHAAKKSPVLEQSVFQSRVDQEARLFKVTHDHPRFSAIVEKNGGLNVESQLRKWVDQQEELKLASPVGERKGSEAPKQKDPDDEKNFYHYPWNATGFYRGEWTREGVKHDNEESEAKEDSPDVQSEDTETEKKETQFLAPIEMETQSEFQEMMKERVDQVGVFLLPRGFRLKLDNLTDSKTDLPDAEIAKSAMRARSNRMSKPASSFLRVVGSPELNVVVNNAEDDTEEEPPQVTLTKDNGRAAFQFYSRSVPAMKELSLVDGFVKLYDSSTLGYSSNRDILLRVRGVLIHSIGRISLVSNVVSGRSALIIGKQEQVPKDRQSNDEKEVTDGASESETETRRRLLQDSVSGLHSESTIDAIENVRRGTLALFPFDVVDDDFGGDWSTMTSFDSLDPDFGFSQSQRKSHLSSLLDNLWATDTEEGEAVVATARRKLSDAVGDDEEDDDEEDGGDDDESSPDASLNGTVTTNSNNDTSVLMQSETRRMKSKKKREPTGEKHVEANIKQSNVVVPYPFVPDDSHGSVRKIKTPAARKMPPREQMLEANAGLCEFEINLDVKETEWTMGEWKALLIHHTREAALADPTKHKTDPDEEDKKEDEAEDKKLAHLKRKHIPSSSRRGERSSTKPVQNQALVMTMTGSIHSPNCDFTSFLNATAIRTDWEHTTGKAINYSFYMMLACLTQIVVLLRQLLHTQNQSAATRVSLLCVGWQTVLDALLCLSHIYLSLAMQPLFTAFASVAFFKLLIFCVIEMKYMAIIIQARNVSNGGQTTTEVLRRQVAMLHLRFYIALVAAFLAFFQLSSTQGRTLYMLALYSFWVPQIIQNIITEAKRPLHNYYIYGMSFTRLVAPIYIFAVPDNFLKEVYAESPTDHFMCELLIAWVGIQAAVLIAQGKYGTRFMIPARFLPPKFDYSRPIPPSLLPPEALRPQSPVTQESSPPLLAAEDSSPKLPTTGTRNRIKKGSRHKESTMTSEAEPATPRGPTLDCVICCNGIDISNNRGYMLAPCDHIFHRDCLVQWMDVKMECPVCRKELPAL